MQYLHPHRRLIKLGSLYLHLGACCFVLCQCNYLHHCSHASSQRIFASGNCDSWCPTRSCPQSCCAKHTLTFFRSFQAGHNKRQGVTRTIISHMMVSWTWPFCLFLHVSVTPKQGLKMPTGSLQNSLLKPFLSSPNVFNFFALCSLDVHFLY